MVLLTSLDLEFLDMPVILLNVRRMLLTFGFIHFLVSPTVYRVLLCIVLRVSDTYCTLY